MSEDQNKNEWLIREALPNELNFIYATWLNSLQSDSQIGKSVSKSLFFKEYPEVIDHILARPLTKVLIAYHPETPDLLLSYLVFEPHVLHYTFTKEIYRKMGIAKSLFNAAFKANSIFELPPHFTHKTFMAIPIIEKYLLIFNPFKLYERNSHE